MEYLISVALNVLSSFIYAALTAWFEAARTTPVVVSERRGRPWTPYEKFQNEDNTLTPRQLRNRALLDKFMLLLLFNFLTFFTLYMALVTPAQFRAMSQHAPLLWSDARVFGDYLPDTVVATALFQWVPFAIAAAAFIPLRFAVKFLASLLRAPWEMLGPYTMRKRLGVAMMFSLVMALCVGALTTYGYWPDKSLAQCFTTTFVLASLAGGMFAAKR